MKRLVLLMCAAVFAMTLTACSGSSDPSPTPTPAPSATPTATPAPTPTPTSEVSPYEQEKQAILEHVDVAYTGLTPAQAPMYFLAGDEGSYVVLVLENKDGQSYIKFAGNAVIDEDSGILTVTDDETGYSFGFSAEKQSNGTYFLDCGNLGEAYLQADEPGNVVDYIVSTVETMEDVTEEFMDAVAKLNFMDSLDVAYTGLTATGAPMFFLASSDGAFAALVLVSSNGEDYISFVGNATVDEESGVLTVTDNEKGYWFGFTAEKQEDGSFFLDCGDLGECYLEPDEIENVVNSIDAVYQELNDVTDALVAQMAG